MTRILEHFVPNTELNLPTLRALAGSLDGAKTEQGLSPMGNGLLGLSPASSSLVSPGKTQVDDEMEAEEIDELHRQMGWLRLDSNGVYSKPTVTTPASHNLQLTNPRTRRPKLDLLLPRRRPLANDPSPHALPLPRDPPTSFRRAPPPPDSTRVRRPPKVAQADKPPPPGPLRRMRGALLPRHPVRVLVLLRRAAARRAGQDIRGGRGGRDAGGAVRALRRVCDHE